MFRNYYSNETKRHQAAAHGRAVAVIGELNVDLVASGLASAPVLGREVLAQDFQTVLGSASAIFACGAARLRHRRRGDITDADEIDQRAADRGR